MSLKHMKSYSAPLIKKEMQITMTMKFIFHLSDCNVKEFNNTEKWLSANCTTSVGRNLLISIKI